MSTLLLVLATGAAILGVDQLSRRRARPRAPLSQAGWARLARRCGLAVRDSPAPRHLRGNIDQIDVTVSIIEEERAVRFTVHAALPIVLPPNAHVTARPGAVGDTPLRSPILRGLLCARGGEAVRAVLDDPAMAGPLLAVFQPRPGATLDALGVHIPGETARPRAELPDAIADAVALAAAAAGAWRRLGPAGTGSR